MKLLRGLVVKLAARLNTDAMRLFDTASSGEIFEWALVVSEVDNAGRR